MRIKLEIEYDGTAYCGWQRQLNGPTIQEKIEEAVCRATGEQTAVHGSGRTDAGVHAMRQVAHFDTDTRIAPDKIAAALNFYLPADIRVLSAEPVPDTFHARFGAKEKTYRYVFRNNPQRTALFRTMSAHERAPLDLESMRAAARQLTGEHDFAAFCSRPEGMNTVRTIRRIDVRRDHEYVLIDVTGNGFLHNMVRIIAGTLAEAGKGNMRPQQIEDALRTGDRSLAGPTAPAAGLFLMQVKYDDA